MIDEAEGLIAEAVELLNGAGVSEYTRRTMIATLEHLVGAGGWLTSDQTLADLREAIENEDE
jgi:hypothetical protein